MRVSLGLRPRSLLSEASAAAAVTAAAGGVTGASAPVFVERPGMPAISDFGAGVTGASAPVFVERVCHSIVEENARRSVTGASAPVFVERVTGPTHCAGLRACHWGFGPGLC